MQFLSIEFTLGLLVVFFLYWSFPNRTWQNLLLLSASSALMLSFGPSALLVLSGSTMAEWLIALKLGETETRRGRLALLWFSVVINVAQLSFFKYSQFFLPQMTALLSHVGFRTGTLSLLMPAGLSFWTLQKMTLTLDVYYRRRPPERSYLNCLMFTSFFPTLLSGPIEYSRNLLPQFERARAWDARRFSEGIWLFAIGAFQKAVIADNVAVCVDELLGPGKSGLATVLGIWAYALQIYGDFAGYSYMARGCARLLGIEVTQNFIAPYLSKNLSDYWSHWHISLSTWLNDFVFTPVSMKFRGWGTGSILLAVWITFLISGIWHGTGKIFLIYGAIHAFGLTLFTLSKDWRKRIKKAFGKDGWPGWIATLITFHWVCMGYIFFRAPNLASALKKFEGVFHGPWNPLAVSCDWSILILSAIGVFWLQASVSRSKSPFWIFERAVWYRVGVYLALGLLLFRFYAPSDRFIYFQF